MTKKITTPGRVCVAWRFLSNLRTLGKQGRRDKERQSRKKPGRETTEKLPARIAGIFCLSSTLAYRPSPLHQKVNTSIQISVISQGTAPRNMIEHHWLQCRLMMRKRCRKRYCAWKFFSNITKLLTAKDEQERTVSNFPKEKDVMAVFPTGFRKSMIFPVFHCLRSRDKNCRLREQVSLILHC